MAGKATSEDAFEKDGDASLSIGERLLRREVVQVPLRIWLYLALFAISHFTDFPIGLSAAGAVLNAMFFLSIVWAIDCYEEEPWRLVERTFLWGALPAIVLAVIAETCLRTPTRFLVGSASAGPFEVTVIAPVVEELCKGEVLLALFYQRPDEFDGMLDGLLYGALVGLGFSMTENITYYVAAEPGALQGLIFLRGVALGMNHACFSACFGLGLGLAS